MEACHNPTTYGQMDMMLTPDMIPLGDTLSSM